MQQSRTRGSGGVRIIGGEWRGRRIQVPARASVRPTPDRVRETLFNWLVGIVPGGRCLDLFAGTGALGLEALSRGAAHVTFVENGRVGLQLLDANIKKARAGDVSRVIGRDATRLGAADKAATLVFLDPPYGKGLGAQALVALQDGGWLAARALVVWEEAAAQDAPEGFALLDSRRYGETHITILEHGE